MLQKVLIFFGKFESKTCRVMKLVILFMIIGGLQVSARGFSQKITLSEKSASLEKIFKEVEKQSGYLFWYEADLIKNSTKVDISVKNADLKEVLDLCFVKQPLTYVIMGKTIVVKKKEISKSLPIDKIDPEEAASVTIKGKVTNENGEPLVGVSVVLKGTTIGTQTNSKGEYSIETKDGKGVLVFSSVGYYDSEVAIKNKLEINVQLVLKANSLEETVVVAYGRSKMKDVTGSMSHIGKQDLENAPMGATVQSMLQGKAAGVNVVVQSASPTSPISVIIRGASSLTGDNQPLWVIDGVPDYSASTSGDIYNTLYNLNLNDVESIDILKDASATALYGSRAANGVVIVTTKKGKIGMTPTIEFSTRIGYQQMHLNGYKYMTSPDYIHFATAAAKMEAWTRGGFDYFTRLYLDEQAFMNMNSSEFDTTDLRLKDGAFFNGNTNWLEEMTHNPWDQQNDLSLRGGTQNISYFVSLFANSSQGIVKTGNSKVYGGRVNLEATLRKGMKFGLNLNGSSRKTNNKDYMLGVLKKIRPDIPPFNEDGTIFTRDVYTENPYTTLKNIQNGSGQSFNGTGFLELAIIKGLLLRTAYTSSYVNSQSLSYKRRGSAFNTNGSRSWRNAKVLTNVWENTLTLARNFGKHDILGLVGFSTERNSIQNYGMSASNFPDDDVLNDFGSGANRGSLTENYSANSLVSGFARGTYKFNDRYIVSGTVRKDGSSRFGPDKRWGWFPSAAAAWIISQENFLKNSNVVSYLKLRASLGLTGSQNLGNYDWRTGIGSSRYNEMPAIAPNTIGNTELQWEQTKMSDIGLDFGLLEDRIRGTFGVYQKITDHLIYYKSLPPSSSFSSISANVASLKNNGVELEIKGDVIKNKNLMVILDFNAGKNINRVIKINDGTIKELNFPDGGTTYMKTKEGERTGQWWGYKTANRLFVNQEEIIALESPTSSGSVQYYRSSLETVGDLYFLDLNKDGKIDVNDRTYLGSAEPEWFGGFGATMIYKNLMVNATFTYSYGNKRLWNQPYEDAGYVGNYNQSTKIAGQSATLINPYDAPMPRMVMYGDGGNGSSSYFSDFWLHDASYIRLNALNVNYRLPAKVFKSSVVQGIDLTFQASNLFTLTNYPGFDPQGNWSSSAIGSGMGIDGSYYPSAKNYNLGIKFTFK